MFINSMWFKGGGLWRGEGWCGWWHTAQETCSSRNTPQQVSFFSSNQYAARWRMSLLPLLPSFFPLLLYGTYLTFWRILITQTWTQTHKPVTLVFWRIWQILYTTILIYLKVSLWIQCIYLITILHPSTTWHIYTIIFSLITSFIVPHHKTGLLIIRNPPKPTPLSHHPRTKNHESLLSDTFIFLYLLFSVLIIIQYPTNHGECGVSCGISVHGKLQKGKTRKKKKKRKEGGGTRKRLTSL